MAPDSQKIASRLTSTEDITFFLYQKASVKKVRYNRSKTRYKRRSALSFEIKSKVYQLLLNCHT